jgi:hypothetical protein
MATTAALRQIGPRLKARDIARLLSGRTVDQGHRAATVNARTTVNGRPDGLSSGADVSRRKPLSNLVVNVVSSTLDGIALGKIGASVITSPNEVDHTAGLWRQTPNPLGSVRPIVNW